jgi:hypothetical protein
MSSIVLSGDTSGTVTVAVPAVAGTNTVTIAAQTGTLNAAGPAFSAYSATTQTGVTQGTSTKVALNTKVFDTATCFNTTNYRFTPTVAGYYQFNGNVNAAGTSLSYAIAILSVNGTSTAYGNFTGTGASEQTSSVSAVIYLNGTTDYLELFFFGLTAAGTIEIRTSALSTRLSGCLIRGA